MMRLIDADNLKPDAQWRTYDTNSRINNNCIFGSDMVFNNEN